MSVNMRLYVDTSVFGGVFDEEFSEESEIFFSLVRRGELIAVISSLTEKELSPAPEIVRNVLETLPQSSVIRIPVTKEAELLAEEYIVRGAVGRQFAADALHIAVATLSSAELVVSWNFKHIVNIFRIRKYNSVNLLFGHRQLEIRSPREVLYEKEGI